MIFKINPENWSKQEITLNVNKKNKTIKINENENTFTFKEEKETGDIKVFGDNWDKDYVLCSGCQFEGIWYFKGMGLMRQDKNMYCAIAKVLMNII